MPHFIHNISMSISGRDLKCWHTIYKRLFEEKKNRKMINTIWVQKNKQKKTVCRIILTLDILHFSKSGPLLKIIMDAVYIECLSHNENMFVFHPAKFGEAHTHIFPRY